jgi:hypothetical protein
MPGNAAEYRGGQFKSGLLKSIRVNPALVPQLTCVFCGDKTRGANGPDCWRQRKNGESGTAGG